MVGMVEEAREDFLQARINSLLILREIGPGLNAGVAGRQLRVARDQTHRFLPLVGFLARYVPALTEAASILPDISLRRLERCVRRAESQVGKERATRAHLLLVPD